MRRAFDVAWLLAFLGLLCFSGPAAAASKELGAEQAWIRSASALVGVAIESTAPIAGFQRDVEASRRQLRGIFLGDPTPTRALRALHMQMLILLSLLEAAAGCHKGGHVSCPPELISQLINQRNAVERLAHAKAVPR
ncbi:MAG TPA: hypothetical protein ENI71_00660 [Chromatiales bacterium]|nr:hypothetical protein [Chromatiales bacterium]